MSDHPAAAEADARSKARAYRVIRRHVSEYRDPITFEKGALLAVGTEYAGPEGWDNWWFCETPGQKGGLVPAQLIEMLGGRTGRALVGYTARELDAEEGDLLFGMRVLNGWAWCENASNREQGWIPLRNLEKVQEQAGIQRR